MKIIEALLKSNIRVSNGYRWLYMQDVTGVEFVVLEHKYGARKTTEVYRGSDEDEAVKFLIGEEE